MNPSPVLVVTGFDAKHFDLALDLAESFRAAYQDRYRLAAIVFGAEPAPPALARIFHRSRATNEYGIALVCPKIQVSNLDQRAGNAEAKLYRRN